jgi:putative phosphoesterase
MATIRAGILSDTHLREPDQLFRAQVAACFADVPVIFHAGDLVHLSVLEAFSGKIVHAVHGNMCNSVTARELPHKKTVGIAGHSIAIIHTAKLYGQTDEQLLAEFPEADCIISGHTHRPVITRLGTVLLINPGSFAATGRFGASGTYAILDIGETLKGQIFEVPTIR